MRAWLEPSDGYWLDLFLDADGRFLTIDSGSPDPTITQHVDKIPLIRVSDAPILRRSLAWALQECARVLLDEGRAEPLT